jgi:hypothetical protein
MRPRLLFPRLRLVRIETKNGGIRFPGADETPIALGRQSVGSIFYDPEVMAPAKSEDRLHIAGKAAKMNRHNRFATRSHSALGIGKIDEIGAGLHIDEYHLGTEIAHHRRRSRKCQRRHDYAIAWPNATGFQREV